MSWLLASRLIPDTGDDNPVYLWLIVMGGALLVMIVCGVLLLRRRTAPAGRGVAVAYAGEEDFDEEPPVRDWPEDDIPEAEIVAETPEAPEMPTGLSSGGESAEEARAPFVRTAVNAEEEKPSPPPARRKNRKDRSTNKQLRRKKGAPPEEEKEQLDFSDIANYIPPQAEALQADAPAARPDAAADPFAQYASDMPVIPAGQAQPAPEPPEAVSPPSAVAPPVTAAPPAPPAAVPEPAPAAVQQAEPAQEKPKSGKKIFRLEDHPDD